MAAAAGTGAGLLATEATTALGFTVCADTVWRFSARLATATMTAGAQHAKNRARARFVAPGAAGAAAASRLGFSGLGAFSRFGLSLLGFSVCCTAALAARRAAAR